MEATSKGFSRIVLSSGQDSLPCTIQPRSICFLYSFSPKNGPFSWKTDHPQLPSVLSIIHEFPTAHPNRRRAGASSTIRILGTRRRRAEMLSCRVLLNPDARTKMKLRLILLQTQPSGAAPPPRPPIPGYDHESDGASRNLQAKITEPQLSALNPAACER
ncbi:hypothetical protein VTI74DRAFT_1506 [Chaetomium olivicolor]